MSWTDASASMKCPSCGAAAPDETPDCPSCGLVFQKWAEREVRRKAEALLAAQKNPAEPESEPATPRTRDAVAVPAAVFLAAGALAWTEAGRFLVHASLAMELHELGHAVVNWLGGRLAVPLPMITIHFSRERSYAFAALVAAALFWLVKRAWDEDCRALAGLGAVLLGLQAWLTLAASLDTLDFWVAFGGLGGECVIAALLVLAYFHRLPRAARWPAYRAVFLFVGACVLALSLRRWRDASADFMNVPWGSFWGGDGDVEAMIAARWTVNVLVKVYLRLAWACVAAVTLRWAAAAWEARGEIAKVTR